MGTKHIQNMGIDNMTIYPQKDLKPTEIKCELPKNEHLKLTTQCCCTAQRFCCMSSQGALKCAQFGDENKTLNSGLSEHKCLDCLPRVDRLHDLLLLHHWGQQVLDGLL